MKYIRWDATNRRYKEVVGLPDPLTANDERLLEYDDTSGTWVAGLKIVVSDTQPTVDILDGDIWVDTDAVDDVAYSLKWVKIMQMCEVNP